MFAPFPRIPKRIFVLSFYFILTAFLLTYISCSKKKPTKSDELSKIAFSSINPTSGPPGTIITITEVGVPSPRESLTVVVGDIRLPAYTQIDLNVMVSCPLMEAGHHDIFLEHPKAAKTFVASFEVTESPETGVPPGQIAEDLTGSVLIITQSLEISTETLKMRGIISDAQSDNFKVTLNVINSIISEVSTTINNLPDSEKVILDQELTAAGLADLFEPGGHFEKLPSSANALREFLATQEEYDAFHGLILGDNISFALSAVKAALTVVNIASAVGSLGLSAPANVALSTISFAVGAVDNVIEGYMPTDLYHVEMAVIPYDGSVFSIGDTAQIEYWGNFRTQSGPISTTISTFINGVFSFMPAAEIDKLIAKIVGEIGVGALEDILGNQEVIQLTIPIKVDISYYQKSNDEVLSYITTALSGILPGIQLLNVLSYAGVSFPGLALDPLVIESDIVSVSDDRLSITALQNGSVSPSLISMTTWVMNPICEGENSWWWTWICLGIELPEFLPKAAYTIPTIVIGTEPQPDLTPPGAILNLSVSDSTSSSITLTWNAPGDDNYNGTATEYDIRFAESAITESNWDVASKCVGEPHPAGSGTPQSFVVAELELNTLHYFAIKTADEVPNWSELSNVASGHTTPDLDVTPPAAISNLMTSNPTLNSITLIWTAPGDDNYNGTAFQYDIRHSTSEITESNWSSATQCMGEPLPAEAGTQESFLVEDLEPNTLYFFAVKTADEVLNWSSLSNVTSEQTHDSLVQLTFSGAVYGSDWSPDGKEVVVSMGGVLYTMTSDGGNKTAITGGDYNAQEPSWSPDGASIAFFYQPYGEGLYDIAVINRDGSNLRDIAHCPRVQQLPDWSPDGNKIAYLSLCEYPYDSEIYLMNADGSGKINVSRNSLWDHAPSWSPDGTKIAFSAYPGDPWEGELWVMNSDGSNQIKLGFKGYSAHHMPTWSPDGSKIAFGWGEAIYIANSDGSNPQLLIEGFYPRWSPDGTRMLLTSREGNLYIRYIPKELQ